MTTPHTAILLAGWLAPPPLRASLHRPLLCLPVSSAMTLVEAWISELDRHTSVDEIRIVTNTVEDRAEVDAAAAEITRRDGLPDVRVIAERAAWRGVAGVLRDVTDDLESSDQVIVAEASCLPPDGLAEIAAPGPHEDSWGGAVGVTGRDEPAGLYRFAVAALRVAPTIGYFDLKEQLLPALYSRNAPVYAVNVGERTQRVRDRQSYLDAVAAWLDRQHTRDDAKVCGRCVAGGASVSGSAVLDGLCLIGDGAVIEDGAVVHDSIIMSGATVGGGAVVSRSVIGPLVQVRPRQQVVNEVLAASKLNGATERMEAGAAQQ